MDPDAAIRASAFAALRGIDARYGPVVPASALRRGFLHEGVRIPFAAQQGIFRPRQMTGGALSIATRISTSGDLPYDDEEIASEADTFLYRYRNNGVDSHDNRMLRQAYELQAPIIYFKGILPAQYSLIYPCFVTHDDPVGGFVRVVKGIVAVDLNGEGSVLVPDEIERRYVMREVKQRLHQQRFRAMVLNAYRERCTVCRLREPSLLEASHILPDKDRRGEASIQNGLSLCAIHHEAYDQNLMAVTPDYRVRLSRRLLDDDDGPMLEQGFKAFHDGSIQLPPRQQDHPSPEFLEERMAQFEDAA